MTLPQIRRILPLTEWKRLEVRIRGNIVKMANIKNKTVFMNPITKEKYLLHDVYLIEETTLFIENGHFVADLNPEIIHSFKYSKKFLAR